jgi:hypothetical protein
MLTHDTRLEFLKTKIVKTDSYLCNLTWLLEGSKDDSSQGQKSRLDIGSSTMYY